MTNAEKTARSALQRFVIRAWSFLRHPLAAPELREGGSFELRHST